VHNTTLPFQSVPQASAIWRDGYAVALSNPANLRPQKAELREAILTRKFNSPKFSVNACASAIDRRVSEEVTCLFWGIDFAGAF
jgi:hypothetical protein